MGVFENDDRFEGPVTAENRFRKLMGTAGAESGPIAPVTFGNSLVRSVNVNGHRTLTDLFLTRFTYTNVRSRRHYVDG